MKMHHSFLIHSFADGHLGYFQILAVVNCAAMNLGLYISFLLVFLISWDIPRSGIIRSNGSFIFNFLRKLHTVLHSGYTSLHSHQPCKRVPSSLHSGQHSSFVNLFMIAILTGVRWYFIVILICIS
uniref:Uncharacterized protein n=1 Tax=Pipistrellus kuhlii TaxID=59472 RepID=A0A7J8A823_PIPKU|nr:hypothetical protein mPipKuh1_008903 [Pipistrellus kuhlii]